MTTTTARGMGSRLIFLPSTPPAQPPGSSFYTSPFLFTLLSPFAPASLPFSFTLSRARRRLSSFASLSSKPINTFARSSRTADHRRCVYVMQSRIKLGEKSLARLIKTACPGWFVDIRRVSSRGFSRENLHRDCAANSSPFFPPSLFPSQMRLRFRGNRLQRLEKRGRFRRCLKLGCSADDV